MPEKVVTLGTIIQVKIGGSYVTIPGVFSITPPNPNRAPIDFTELGDEWMQYKVGPTEPGEAGFSIHFDPGNSVHQTLSELIIERETIGEYKIVYADTGEEAETFTGWMIGKEKPELTVGGKLVRVHKIKCSGEIVGG